MKKKTMKAAIIGCGNIFNNHAKGYISSDGVELYAICDILDEKLESAKKLINMPDIKCFSDYKEMIKLDEIDIVSVCVPSGLHAKIGIDCAKAGKHILVEKPLDINSQNMTNLISSCKDNNVKLAAVFQCRTSQGILKAKEMLDSGELGKVLIADAIDKEYRSPEYYKSAGWRGTWALDGGGCLMNQGVHTIDLLCWLSGGIKSVYARTMTLSRDIEVEDVAQALLTLKSGGVGTILGTTLCAPGIGERIDIQCEKGRITFEEGKSTTFSYYEKENGENKVVEINLDEEIDEENTKDDPLALTPKKHTFLIGNFVEAINNNTDPFVTGEDARHAVDVILAIYESSKTKKEVFI